MQRGTLVTLSPVWGVAALLALAQVMVGHDRPQPLEITMFDLAVLVVSVGILPFLAGFLYVRRSGGSIPRAVMVGATVRVADIAGVGIAYAVLQAGWLALGGFVIATIVSLLIPAALFGGAGGWAARRYESKHT